VSSSPLLIRSDNGGVTKLTLNSPKNFNALSDGMLSALQTELGVISKQKSVRVVVINGAGKAFCAGHDLKEMQSVRDGGREDSNSAAAIGKVYGDLFKRCASVMLSIRNLPQPVIAQVHGVATAAGCQLVATCDMAVAANTTRFGVNGVNIGLFCSTPMVALTRKVPAKAAFEMLSTGSFIDANKAFTLGLINKVVDESKLDEETNALAEIVSSKLGLAIRYGKQAFYKQESMSLEDAYEFTGSVMVQNLLEEQTKNGIEDFLHKKTPKWNQ
jgi:enoyl-CoA hydratase/carnithine racemase